MKKLLSVLLAFCFLFVLAACGDDPAPDAFSRDTSSRGTSPSGGTSSDDPSDSDTEENYATVMVVTINPQFLIYLDKNDVIFAVTAGTTDAEPIINSLTLRGDPLETAFERLVTATNEQGFIREDPVITVAVLESTKSAAEVDGILKKIENAIYETADKLHVRLTVFTDNPYTLPD